MNIQTRLENLEKLVTSLSKKIDGNKFYQEADTASERIGISANANGVSENDQAICEVAELEDTDSQAIDELAEMVDTNSTAIDDLAELVDELLQEINDLKGGQ